MAMDPQFSHAPAANAELPPPSGGGFFTVVWRRKWLIAVCLMVALGLGYLVFLRQTPVYQSRAEVLIVSNATLPIPGMDVKKSDYDNTRLALLRSPLIVDRAVKTHNLDKLPSLRGAGDPVSRIITDLRVMSDEIRSPNIVEMTYKSYHRDDCPKVLSAIADAYRHFMGVTYEAISEETVRLIEKARSELDSSISQMTKEYNEWLAASPLLVLGDATHNVHEERLANIELVRSEAVLEISKLEAKIDSLQTALKTGGRKEALRFLIQTLNRGSAEGTAAAVNANSASVIENQLFPLLLQEQMLLERFGADYPEVKAIRKQIEFARQHYLGLQSAEAQGTQPAKDIFEVYIESVQEQIRINDATVQRMNELFTAERTKAQELAKYKLDDSNWKENIDRKKKMFDAIVKRLEEIQLVKGATGTKVTVIAEPRRGSKISPNLNRTLAISSVLGLIAGLGLAYLVDLSDRRFRSPDEIRATLGLPVIGHIPVIDTDGIRKHAAAIPAAERSEVLQRLDPSVAIFHRPKGRIAESYRGIRTSLYFSVRGRGHQVIQVTSPHPGDGKTTMAVNLAVSIAQSGKQVLLLDADFRRPRIHKLIGIEPEIGVTSVLSGDVELGEALAETGIPNLTLLACGQRPDNPSELLTSRRFEDLLSVLREKFEIVIVDTPPVLAVTDPLNVAPRVDGVMLVLRLTKSARGAAQRAIEALDSLNANVLGIVVNGVGGTSDYGYGRYGGDTAGGYRSEAGAYGYQGGYGYGFDDGDGRYFSEDSDAPATVSTASVNRLSNGRH